MKRIATLVLGVATMLLVANASFATIFPNASCPDSVTIKQLWHGTDMGAPAPVCKPFAAVNTAIGSDTVMGMGGIVIGIDAIATGYGFYMQNTGGLDSMGIDVFTGGKNLVTDTGYNLSLARGDSIVVEWGATEAYQGSLEVLAPNNNQSAPNFIVRKVSAGNALPPMRIYTTHDLNYVNDPTSVGPRSYLCGLVRVNGPLVVGRKVGTYEFMAVDPTLPTDSVDVYGATLTSYAAPNVGTVIDWIQGIAEHRTPGSRSMYEVLLRDGNDISVATPPGVTDAYCIAENQIRISFDRDVTTASAENVGNYSLASFGSIDAAVMDGSTAVILTVSGAAVHGTNETVQITGVAGVANGLAITTPATRTFVMGLLSVAEVSAPNADSLTANPCFDKSKYAGGGGLTTMGLLGVRCSFVGNCTGTYGTLNYFEDASPASTGNHGGLAVYGAPISFVSDHSYVLAGAVQEFFGETEFSGIVYGADHGTSPAPAPLPLTVAVAKLDSCTADPLPRGEMFESMLVKLENVMRVVRYDYTSKPVNGFHVAGPDHVFSDTMFVQNLNGVLGASDSLNANYPAEFAHIDVTGALHYESGSYRVCPRTAADIQIHYVNVAQAPKPLAFSVYPNPARRATISFTLPSAAKVELGVFDVTGRKVATLVNGNFPAGEYSRGWLGRDDRGNQVASGVYFYRLKAGNETRTVRAIMLGN